jgi:hypothetical protein
MIAWDHRGIRRDIDLLPDSGNQPVADEDRSVVNGRI